jgi:predicted dehydrogenase
MAETMIEAMRDLPGLAVTAVASDTPGRAAAFARRLGLVQGYDGTAALLADPGIDLVYVANRTRDHARTSVQALEAGKAVLCEKPFAVTAAEADAVARAAAASGSFFMEAMWTLALPAHRRMETLAAGGAFGAPRQLDFAFGYPATAEERQRLMGPQDGGILAIRGCYGIAASLRLLGPVEAVETAPGFADDAAATVMLRHAGGGRSVVTVATDALLANTAILACERGLVGVAAPVIGGETVLTQRAAPAGGGGGSGNPLRRLLRRLAPARRLWAARSGPRREWQPYGRDPYHPMLAHVAARLAEGRAESDLVPIALSCEIARIVETARRAGGVR